MVASTGPREHEVQERVDAGAIEVFEIDAAHPRSVPERVHARREDLTGAHGCDQEDEVGIDQLTDERGRGRVEQMEIIDEQHEGPVRGLAQQDGLDLRHDCDQIAALVRDARRE